METYDLPPLKPEDHPKQPPVVPLQEDYLRSVNKVRNDAGLTKENADLKEEIAKWNHYDLELRNYVAEIEQSRATLRSIVSEQKEELEYVSMQVKEATQIHMKPREAIPILASQRDNAYNEAETYRKLLDASLTKYQSRIGEKNALIRKLTDDVAVLTQKEHTFRKALEAIVVEVGTSTLTHKIAATALRTKDASSDGASTATPGTQTALIFLVALALLTGFLVRLLRAQILPALGVVTLKHVFRDRLVYRAAWHPGNRLKPIMGTARIVITQSFLGDAFCSPLARAGDRCFVAANLSGWRDCDLVVHMLI